MDGYPRLKSASAGAPSARKPQAVPGSLTACCSAAPPRGAVDVCRASSVAARRHGIPTPSALGRRQVPQRPAPAASASRSGDCRLVVALK